MDPIAHPLEQKPTASSLLLPNESRNMCILHVDDNAKDHALFKAAAADAKVPILWHYINSATAAISYLQRLLKASTPSWPDLVLLDITMPGESGLKVLEYTCTKPEFKKLPVVIFSGTKDPKMTARAGLLGAKSVIAKPASYEEAIQLIESIYQLFSLTTQRRPTGPTTA
jgi:CheY-like chemotaxis protein